LFFEWHIRIWDLLFDAHLWEVEKQTWPAANTCLKMWLF
jgi:hypothetical protein